MLLEDVLLAVAIGIVGLFVAWPLARLFKAVSQRQRDPLAEAQERLRVAKLEAEAARVNREADRIYETLYEETLQDGREAGRARVETKEELAAEPGQEERRPVEPPPEKGKTHGHE